MHHPLSGKSLFFYAAVWIIISMVHTAFLYLNVQLELTVALTDALICNLIIAGFGFIYWHVVKYLIPAQQGFSSVVISHVLGVIIGVGLSTYLSLFLLRNIFSADATYISFINSTYFWRIVVGVFYLTVITMIYYLLLYNSRIQQKEKEEINLQYMLRNAELETLKFQLNPHFIFNSLNSISSLTITNPARAQEMVIRLSEFLRSSLNNKNPEFHSLKEELKHMKLYLEIEKVRFGDRILLTEHIDNECMPMELPNMILQPLYENAIKFGLYEQLGQLKIETSASYKNKALHITIKNNYDNISPSKKGRGIGLPNVQQRLFLLYSREDLMEVKNENGTFEVYLIIPQP